MPRLITASDAVGCGEERRGSGRFAGTGRAGCSLRCRLPAVSSGSWPRRQRSPRCHPARPRGCPGWGEPGAALPRARCVPPPWMCLPKYAKPKPDKCVNDGTCVSPAPKLVNQTPDAMGTGFRSCSAAFSINGPLGMHQKNKCYQFSGLSESDYYLT